MSFNSYNFLKSIMCHVQLNRDVYSVIYSHLDDVSKTMMALSCKSFLKFGIPHVWGKWFCNRASYFGYLNILKWAHNKKFPWDGTCMLKCIGGRSFRGLKMVAISRMPMAY